MPRSRSSDASARRQDGELVALAGRRALLAGEILGDVDAPRRIAGARRLLEQALRRLSRLGRGPPTAHASARPMLPSASAAAARASGSVYPWSRISTSATSAGDSGPKRRRGQRDSTVGSSASGIDDTRMKTDADGGSSSVFSSAFCAGAHHRVRLVDDDDAPARLERPVAGARSMTSRTCSILIVPVSPGSRMMTSGCTPRAMRRHDGALAAGVALEDRVARAPCAMRSRQLIACASATAVRRLPTPAGRPAAATAAACRGRWRATAARRAAGGRRCRGRAHDRISRARSFGLGPRTVSVLRPTLVRCYFLSLHRRRSSPRPKTRDQKPRFRPARRRPLSGDGRRCAPDWRTVRAPSVGDRAAGDVAGAAAPADGDRRRAAPAGRRGDVASDAGNVVACDTGRSRPARCRGRSTRCRPSTGSTPCRRSSITGAARHAVGRQLAAQAGRWSPT